MSFAELFLPEFEHEMNGTRSVLQLVPDSLLTWKAHDSLNTVGWVASHLVDTLSWAGVITNDESFDVAPPDGEPHQTPILEAAAELVPAFDANLASAKEAIAGTSDADFQKPWTLLHGGKELFSLPRAAVTKTFLLNHVIHHRAFLIAYLRMNGIECPGMYDG